MGMTRTSFNPPAEEQMAVGYMPDGTKAPLVDLGWVSPAGQMYSSVADMQSLMASLLARTDSPILSRDSNASILKAVFVNPDGNSGFGTPWELILLDKETFGVDTWLVTKGGNIYG